jgi:hypothetical protein
MDKLFLLHFPILIIGIFAVCTVLLDAERLLLDLQIREKLISFYKL